MTATTTRTRDSSSHAALEAVLLATDFSEAGQPAVDYAVALARRLGARITALHVYSIPIYPLLDGMVIPSPAYVTEVVASVTAQLGELQKRLAHRGCVIDVAAIDGPVVDTIVGFARDRGFGLVVLGTHGRTGLDRLALGSVAERVVRRSTVPVITVPDLPSDDGIFAHQNLI